MHQTADAKLVALARGGDKDAFGQLIERYQPMAGRIALGVVAHDEVARELAQEAMLQAYLSLDRLRDDGRLGSWLYGIVLNVCRSHIRGQKTAPLSLEAIVGGLRFDAVPFTNIEPSPEDVVEAQELHTTVLQAVSTLSPKNRAATLLFYYEQLSVREIAATLGVSVSAVKGRLHKARGQLRGILVSVYSDLNVREPLKRREIQMVEVTIADVVQREQKDLETDRTSTQYVVLLLDQNGRRLLPIWVGPAEGQAIAIGLRDVEVPRPLTHAFMVNLLEAVGFELEEVRVEKLRGDTFYAVVKLRSGDTVRGVDARPSDALALAVYTGRPIYAAEEVMEKTGMSIPEDVAIDCVSSAHLGQLMGN